MLITQTKQIILINSFNLFEESFICFKKINKKDKVILFFQKLRLNFINFHKSKPD